MPVPPVYCFVFMRKIILSAVLFITCFTLSAQVETFVFGGPQVTTANYKINGVKQPTSDKFGFQLGAQLKVPFENKLFFAPAVFYSLKGYKVKFNEISYPPDSS